MIKFTLIFLLAMILLMVFIFGTSYLTDPIRDRREQRRLRKTCPTCRDGLAAVLVNNPDSLCPGHRRRLHQIEQLERDELS